MDNIFGELVSGKSNVIMDDQHNGESIPSIETENSPKADEPLMKLAQIDRILVHQYLMTYGCNKISGIESLQKQITQFGKLSKRKIETERGEKLWMHFQLYLSHLKEVPQQKSSESSFSYFFFGFDVILVLFSPFMSTSRSATCQNFISFMSDFKTAPHYSLLSKTKRSPMPKRM